MKLVEKKEEILLKGICGIELLEPAVRKYGEISGLGSTFWDKFDSVKNDNKKLMEFAIEELKLSVLTNHHMMTEPYPRYYDDDMSNADKMLEMELKLKKEVK